MQSYILFAACILVTGSIGWNLLYLLSGRRGFSDIAMPEKIGLAYLFGFGIISVQMFIMSLFGLGFTRFNILIPWVFVMAGTGLAGRSLRGTGLLSTKRKPVPVKGKELVILCLIALQTIYNFVRALIRPMESYDAVSIYSLKSKIICLAHGISADFFSNLSSFFHGAHPDYPLLIPLSETWVYTFLGGFDDLLVKAIFPLFYLSFVFVFYSMLKKITKSRFVSLLFTFLLVSIKQFSDYATIGYADLELGIYFAVSIFYLFLWMGDREKGGFLWVSLAASIFCIWTKNEGMMLALIAAGILSFYILMNIRRITKREIAKFLIYTLVILLIIVSWGMFKDSKTLINENFNLSMINFENLVRNLDRIPAILYEYQKQLFGFKKWNIIWILFVFILLKEFKTAVSGNIKYVTCTFLLVGIGYSLVYIFSAVGIKFLLSTTGSRFLLHILPVAIFWMAFITDRQKLLYDNA